MNNFGRYLPVTDELVSKLIGLKDLEVFFIKGYRAVPSQINKTTFKVEDVNSCIDNISEELKEDYINVENELKEKFTTSDIQFKNELCESLNNAINYIRAALAPGNTKAFLAQPELGNNIAPSAFEKNVDEFARLQHGLRVIELATPLIYTAEKYLMDYEYDTEPLKQNNKKAPNRAIKVKTPPDLTDYLKPNVLEQLCIRLLSDDWIKKENGKLIWQLKKAQKLVPNEHDKSLENRREKNIIVRDTSLVALYLSIEERKWMFLPNKDYNKIRPLAIAFLNYFGLLPKDPKKINHKVRLFYPDSYGDTEHYQEEFYFLDELKKFA
jgi:hypothetical protein